MFIAKAPLPTYTVFYPVDLKNKQVLMLKRSPSRSFAPNQWTGIGGRVMQDEAILYGALRELNEEAGLNPNDLEDIHIVADLWHGQNQRIVHFVAYHNGIVEHQTVEGELVWIPIHQVLTLDIVNDTKLFLKEFLPDVLLNRSFKHIRGNIVYHHDKMQLEYNKL